MGGGGANGASLERSGRAPGWEKRECLQQAALHQESMTEQQPPECQLCSSLK